MSQSSKMNEALKHYVINPLLDIDFLESSRTIVCFMTTGPSC